MTRRPDLQERPRRQRKQGTAFLISASFSSITFSNLASGITHNASSNVLDTPEARRGECRGVETGRGGDGHISRPGQLLATDRRVAKGPA